MTNTITRRTVLGGLSATFVTAVLPVACSAQNGVSGIRLKKIHCFEVRVSDPERTVSFYQDLFGMNVISRFGGRDCLQVGDSEQFMAVRPLQAGEVSAITQLGYSVENYDEATMISGLESLGFSRISAPSPSVPGLANAMHYWVSDREGTPELYFADGRGVIVQLVDSSYRGSSGPLGAEIQPVETADPGLFRLTEINHFTAFTNDGAGANTFYQQAFDLEVQAYQGPGSPVTGIGDGKQFVMYAGPFPGGESAPANLHHGCFNMHGFDEQQILDSLTAYGLSARGDGQIGPLMHYVSRRMPERGGAEGGTPEVYFTDPDGILMQLQDVSYCGGGGYLGNECLQVGP